MYPESITMPSESVFLDTDESSSKMFLVDNLEETVIKTEIKVESETVENVVDIIVITNSLESDAAGPSEAIDDCDDLSSDGFSSEDSKDSDSDTNQDDELMEIDIKKQEPHTESGFGIMKCVTCSREYNTTQSFLIHKRLHNVKAEHLDCEVCGKLIELKMYVTHVSQCFGDIGTGPLKCALKTCEMETQTIEELSTHLRNHPFAPKRVYTKRKKLPSDGDGGVKKKKRIQRQYPDKKIPCQKCGKMMGSSTMVKHMFSHEKDHLKVKKKEPKYPRKKIKRNGEPYSVKVVPCPVCSKMCTPYELRTKHQYVHLGYTPYKCPICLKGLSTARTVKIHIFQKHPQNYESPDSYICTECPENVRFDSCDKFSSHMNEAHRKQEQEAIGSSDEDIDDFEMLSDKIISENV